VPLRVVSWGPHRNERRLRNSATEAVDRCWSSTCSVHRSIPRCRYCICVLVERTSAVDAEGMNLVDVVGIVYVLEQAPLDPRCLYVNDGNGHTAESVNSSNDPLDPLGVTRRRPMLQAQFMGEKE